VYPEYNQSTRLKGNSEKDLTTDTLKMIEHMRREIMRREKEKEKNRGNIEIMMRAKEEAERLENLNKRLPQPDCKKMFYTSSGREILFSQD